MFCFFLFSFCLSDFKVGACACHERVSEALLSMSLLEVRWPSGVRPPASGDLSQPHFYSPARVAVTFDPRSLYYLHSLYRRASLLLLFRGQLHFLISLLNIWIHPPAPCRGLSAEATTKSL